MWDSRPRLSDAETMVQPSEDHSCRGNKALLDTDMLSELGRGVNPTVMRNGAAYLAALGRYTVSVVTVMEIVRGLCKKQASKQLQAFLAGIPSQEVLIFRPDRRRTGGTHRRRA